MDIWGRTGLDIMCLINAPSFQVKRIKCWVAGAYHFYYIHKTFACKEHFRKIEEKRAGYHIYRGATKNGRPIWDSR